MSAEIYLDYQHRDDGRPLLWPVWVWTVHVPERKRDAINALARVVLELAASGSDPTEIAQWLGLDVDFIRYIIAAQLVPNGWLDHYRKLTDDGRRLLDDSSGEGLTQRAAHLFQSADSGALWPRLRGDLQEMEPVDYQDGFPRFQLDRGTGRVLKPFRLRPSQAAPSSPPDAEQVLEALRGDALARHQSRQRAQQDQSFGADDNLPASAIEFIDQTPRLAWVLCRVYRRPGARHPWLVSDPLGRTPAADWMRREVYAAAQRVPGLASMLKELLGETDADESWEVLRPPLNQENRLDLSDLRHSEMSQARRGRTQLPTRPGQ